MSKNIIVYIFFTFLTLVNTAKGKVTPKNYDFTYDKFKEFYPGQNLSDIKKKYKDLRIVTKNGPNEIYEVDIIHIRYKFPLLFQVNKEGIVQDFYGKLPNYFIHDIFHQSLINRFGMQNHFTNTNNTSHYIWTNAEGLVITYSGGCTITCFPIFIHGVSNKDVNAQKNSILSWILKSSNSVPIKKEP